MLYAKLKTNGEFDKFVPNELTEWNSENYCTPEALVKDSKAGQFGIVEVNDTPPSYDSKTEILEIQGVLILDGQYFVKYVARDKNEQEILEDTTALIKGVTDSTQNRLDSFARTRNYDGILSACTYATSGVPKFQAEGQYCVNARDSTWASLYQILVEVQQGIRPVPSSYADIEGDLPILEWPEVPN